MLGPPHFLNSHFLVELFLCFVLGMKKYHRNSKKSKYVPWDLVGCKLHAEACNSETQSFAAWRRGRHGRKRYRPNLGSNCRPSATVAARLFAAATHVHT